jgi:hypothetical protein
MSEQWTPNTEGVRMVFSFYPEMDGALKTSQRQAIAEFDRWLAEHDAEVRADQIEIDAKLADAGGTHWDAKLVGFRHLYPAEIATELRSQKIAYMEEEN